MSKASWVMARAARLPAVRRTPVAVEEDVEVKTADGTVLLTDHWHPVTANSAPIVLVRSPYGRRQFGFVGRLFAERGYQCVIQSCRGTFGSGGSFDPFHHERADGLDTLRWLENQAWFSGAVGTFGPSYLGLTQWAIAGEAPEFVKAMSLSVTASRVRDAVVFPGGSFSLETGATWVDYVESQELPGRERLRATLAARRQAASAFDTLPLREADLRSRGHRIGFYQDWLAHEQPGDPWWDPLDFSASAPRVPPATFVGGWYDIFLPALVDDFVRVRQAGGRARLTIGPWSHVSWRGGATVVRDALEWFDGHLRSDAGDSDRAPVRLYIMGAKRWVDLEDWPPPADVQRWYLQPGYALSPVDPRPSAPDAYRYDPADPTPGVGGASLDLSNTGPRRQDRRERRRDVLSYSSEPMTRDLTVAGPLTADIWLESSNPCVDLSVRLCDVDPSGRSRNISDGILRLDRRPDSANGSAGRVRVQMWPTAVTYRHGHRIRLQVSSGAHPLFARNPGSGEPLATATTLVSSDVRVYHDDAHPSAIELPVSPI
jgi:putative CocE/NonD family hydrolase